MTRKAEFNRHPPDRRENSSLREISQLRRLGAFIRPYRRHFAIAMIGVLVASGLGLVFPRITGTLVDTALQESTLQDLSRIDGLALLLVGVFAAQAAFLASAAFASITNPFALAGIAAGFGLIKGLASQIGNGESTYVEGDKLRVVGENNDRNNLRRF